MAVTVYGVCAVSFMMVMYALEDRGRGFILSTTWIGLVGVAIAAGAITATAVVRRRRNRCVTTEIRTPVMLRPKPRT